MIPWINSDENGFVVQSFETSGVGGNLDDNSVAHLLSRELQRIQEIDKKATEVVLSKGLDFNYEGPNVPENSTYGAKTAAQQQSISPFSETGQIDDISDFSFLSLKDDSFNYRLYDMGSLGIGGTQFSPGNLLLFLKGIMRKTPSPITGSIQRYNSTIIIVATLEDHNSDKFSTWDVRKDITGNSEPLYGLIPTIISDFSFHIASDLGRIRKPETYYPKSWQALKFQIKRKKNTSATPEL